MPVERHTLAFEGAPHDDEGNRIVRGIDRYVGVGGEGRAKCSCGQLSSVLPSAYKRKQWHREHKDNQQMVPIPVCTRWVTAGEVIGGLCPTCGHHQFRHRLPGERGIDDRCTGCINDKIRAEHPPEF